MPNATLFAWLAAGSLALLSLLPSTSQAQQLDPTFHPPHFELFAGQDGFVQRVLRQADGRYLVMGAFQLVDGRAASGLVRLLPNGSVDTTFVYRSGTTTSTNWPGYPAVAVQADGKVLIKAASSTYQPLILRLLPSGQPDSTFRFVLPPRLGSSGRFSLYQMLMQPDGKLLLTGFVSDSVNTGLLRLMPSGRVDSTFTPPATMPPATSALLEPNGRIVYVSADFAYNGSGSRLGRLLPSGRADSSFVFTPQANARIGSIALCPDGSYALGGAMIVPAVSTSTVARLLPNGAWDTQFPFSLQGGAVATLGDIPDFVSTLAVQPNGQIIVGGYLRSVTYADAPIGRTLAQGGTDTSFDVDFIRLLRTVGPASNPILVYNAARINTLSVESGNRLVVGGRFEQVGGVPHFGLARLLLTGPLATASTQKSTPLEVWPVPAHGELHVQLPATQAAQQVELLDATGRRVLTQPVRTAALTLHTTALPTGLYVLRVRYTDGTAATRRVVLD
ncbi:T9SS type A sorting domain-containing protein [Hymenobacter negativus]|uniref:T9SS type A sorting domain-containing protein n=1 Tax=Hymenobacter negativus TaxID=2795026 RepID=A0ABS3QDQ9_9BACT|nr:T9SS type A sorting domain-containing protein [Hymenobacter negativus]MBO2009246.1 T9SS type A sorting domain-containing protein [Hymenobacter negativus]